MTRNAAVVFLRRVLRVARTEIAALSAILILGAGVVGFVELADVVTEAEGRDFDWMVLSALRPQGAGEPWGPWWLHEAAADLTSLGGIAVLGLFAVIAVTFLLIQKKRLSALLLISGLAGGVALSEGLKAVFERERPPSEYQTVETLNASFPSGHALLATVFYLSLGVMLTRAFPQQRLKGFVLGVAIALALTVGTTRIYLGAHWATDVLAGWAVGASWAMALWLVSYAVARRQIVHHAPLQDEGVTSRD